VGRLAEGGQGRIVHDDAARQYLLDRSLHTEGIPMPIDPDLERRLTALVDHHAVTDTLYRYASTIDVKDFTGLRAVLADDVVGVYGAHEPVVGGDELVDWIREMTRDRAWQHHKLTVYHVEIDGDEARALTYHTSHQTTHDDPDTVIVIVARYHDTLVRVGDGWRIKRKVMESGWRERRTAAQANTAI
jgi:ketosteroid isomerase-like protein